MKKFLCLILVLGTVFIPASVSSALEISADSAILIDAETGRVIYEKNADKKLSMASTTKIITAITAIENSNLDDVVTISANAAMTEGSSVWLKEGERLTVSELLYALMLESGNDASVAIAEHVGGDVENFSQMMNSTCKKAGAEFTNCVTPSGLDDEMHYTTARDMAKISRYAMRSDVFREIVSTYKTTIPWEGNDWDRTLVNHNKLLTMYEGTDGIKTGYTKKSGRCLVSSAVNNNWRVIAVTLNAPDDWNDHIRMFEHAFLTYKDDIPLVKKDETLGEIYVQGNKKGKIEYCAKEEVLIKRLSGEDDIKIEYFVPEKIEAPITSGAVVGSAEIFINNDYYKSLNLVSKSDAKRDSGLYIIVVSFKKLLEILLYSVR